VPNGHATEDVKGNNSPSSVAKKGHGNEAHYTHSIETTPMYYSIANVSSCLFGVLALESLMGKPWCWY